jgi:hypothetical protein
MASAPVKKTTIKTLPAALFIGLAVIFDSVKILLLFIDGVPFIGAPIGFLGSWIVSFFEFIFITVGLYISGAYKGKNSSVNTLLTLFVGAIDFVPFLDDFPFMTGEVITIIVRSRINDKREYKEAIKKYNAQVKLEREQEGRIQKAQKVKMSVSGQQQQAVATSAAYAQEQPGSKVPPPPSQRNSKTVPMSPVA